MACENKTETGCLTVILALVLGGICFDYSLWALFGKEVDWWADVLCGLFICWLVIPTAIVCKILTLAGLAAPFFK